MHRRIHLLLLASVLSTSLAFGQADPSPTPQSNNLSHLTGVWRAQMDGLPAFVLVLTDEGGSLRGAILFYLHKRIDANHPYSATPGLPEPLFNLHFDGNILTFQVSHRRAHPPGSLNDPPASFSLTLTGSGAAQVRNLSEGPAISMNRSEY